MNAQPISTEIIHETFNGQDRHLFKKVDGDWTCECGERRDRFGKPLPDLLTLVPPIMESE